MLRTIRIILAILSILAVTLLFVDFTGTARALWPWMAKIQFMPAVLSANIIVVAALLVGTLIFGRIYCSIICPLGILQDVANWMRGYVGNRKKQAYRFKYVPAHTTARLVVLTGFVICIILGLTAVLFASIAGLLEPYSAYGRIASQIFAPIVYAINNGLANGSESLSVYTVAYAVSIPVLVIAIITFVVVTVMAWLGGRDYCNTICPVGTIFGYVAKFSLLRPVIDTNKCIGCTKCACKCKAKCIDAKHHSIDYSRCVACMDCINSCQEGAIAYTWRRNSDKEDDKQTDGNAPDSGRRAFVSLAAAIAGTAALNAAIKTDGGLAPLKGKTPIKRGTAIVPAGAVSLKHFSQHCTGCQLCVQACPSGVLKPRLSLDGFLQPALDFTDGYCRTDCNKCSSVCPDGAYHPISVEEKTVIKVGTAVVDFEACISARDGKACGSCASHCPADAIQMIESNGNLRPVVDEEACIGCGKCEFYCPVGRVESLSGDSSAIHVEGIEVHREV